ncbi:hypothetical protein QTP88_018922 [Uroleucon formosanum]
MFIILLFVNNCDVTCYHVCLLNICTYPQSKSLFISTDEEETIHKLFLRKMLYVYSMHLPCQWPSLKLLHRKVRKIILRTTDR